MSLMDAPNQQAVGLDPPWVEGTGGSEAKPKATAKKEKKAEADTPAAEDK